MCCCLVFGVLFISVVFFFFFKQKTAYEMRISDWSSDVCSSDLRGDQIASLHWLVFFDQHLADYARHLGCDEGEVGLYIGVVRGLGRCAGFGAIQINDTAHCHCEQRSEEHTSELQSLMRISYAVFCLKKKNTITSQHIHLN